MTSAYPHWYAPYLSQSAVGIQRSSLVERALARVEGNATRWLRAKIRSLLKAPPDPLPFVLKKFYEPPTPGARLLDYGCGSKRFLDEARLSGWQTLGMDFAESVVAEVDRAGHRAFLAPCGWREIGDGSLDAVRLNHVIEHLYHPGEMLAIARRKLRVGGRLHIATPNPAGLSAFLFRSCWYGLEAPRHVMLYSPPALSSFLERHNFCNIRIIAERSTKDLTRSLGNLLHAAGLIPREEVTTMATDRLLSAWAELLMLLALRLGRPDRYHVFAEVGKGS
ncbi:MAG TPA: class I SAM-dependent methyltransferase [Dehalococcoidia bacterium]|nr:class I SAM-dependent methyltransferase [Dehalococcoidia bacterium]